MGCPRQEKNGSGLPFPSPGDLPDPGTEPTFPALAGGFFTTEPPGKPKLFYYFILPPPRGGKIMDREQLRGYRGGGKGAAL